MYASPLSGRDIDFDVMTYVNADFCARQDPEISQMPAGKERDVAAWNATNRWRDDTLQLGLDCNGKQFSLMRAGWKRFTKPAILDTMLSLFM